MDPFEQVVTSILDQSPAPALTLEQLDEALTRDGALPGIQRERTLKSIEKRPDIRILWRPRGLSEAVPGPAAWVVFTGGRPAGQPERGRSVPEKLRRTLIGLSETVEPGSTLAWARWNRMLGEEARVRASLTPAG